MKKSILAVALICAAGFTMANGNAQAQGLAAPTEPITIEGKKPASFNHASHTAQGMACGVCHHDANHQPKTAEAIAASTPEALACVSCHNKEFADKDLQKPMQVFHARCQGCHKAGYEGRKGPVKCGECHVKKEKKKAAKLEGC